VACGGVSPGLGRMRQGPPCGGVVPPHGGGTVRAVDQRWLLLCRSEDCHSFFGLLGGECRGAVSCEVEFPSFCSEQWSALWKVVAESPGGMFVVGD
jgi:hypothetical protein